MIKSIVRSSNPVTFVGAGHATPEDLRIGLTLASHCVAADGGAQLAHHAGVSLDALVGDFDSISPEVLADTPLDRRHHVAEQDSTDFEKGLRRIDAPLVIGVGFTGGRIDHQLAVFHVLAAYPEKRCILIGAEEIVLLAPPELNVPTQHGDVVSLFPLTKVTGRSNGLRWPIKGLAFDPMRQIGTSNEAIGPIALTMTAPGMLLVLPRRLIQPVVAQMLRPDAAQWPARA